MTDSTKKGRCQPTCLGNCLVPPQHTELQVAITTGSPGSLRLPI